MKEDYNILNINTLKLCIQPLLEFTESMIQLDQSIKIFIGAYSDRLNSY